MARDDKEATATTSTNNAPSATNWRPKGVLTNASWNGFFTLWSIAISFLLTPILIHYLGTEQYGVLLLIWSITGVLSIANLGLGEATLRYVAYHYGNNDVNGVNRVFGATLSFYVVICFVISGIMMAAAPAIASLLNISSNEYNSVHWPIRLSALVFSLGIISRAFGAIPMALHRYDISSKINILQSVIRSIGYFLLVMTKFGILHLVLWDIATLLGTLLVQVSVIRKLAPEVKLIPSYSFRGFQEILGYSIFSLLTTVFLTIYRESGKLLLGRYIGPSSVAYLGTPDNVEQRIYTVIVSGSETMMPRFSSNRDPEVAKTLFLNGTWAALAVSIIFFIPIAVLMPDFLRLWINPEFARESAEVAQLLAVSYITQGTFVLPATFFRGTGKPWIVTAVLALAGIGTLLFSVVLIPIHGVLGIGYAYFFSSIIWPLGLFYGWFKIFKASSVAPLVRLVILPLVLSGVAFLVGNSVRGWFSEVTWFGLFALGGFLAGFTAALLLGTDLVLGGDSPSKQFLKRIGQARKLNTLFRYFSFGRAR